MELKGGRLRSRLRGARPSGRGWKRVGGRSLVYVLLIAFGLVMVLPVLWALSTALKSSHQTLTVPPQWVPNPFHPENFIASWRAAPFPTYYLNSFLIVAFRIVGQLASSVLIAYGFARIKFTGRNVLFLIVLGTLMIPGQALLVPRFILFKYFGWLDTFLPLIVPSYFGGPLAIFLLRQYFLGIPKDLLDAARIDGCGHLRTLWRIVVPLSKPALGAVAVLEFADTWDDFQGPLVYLSSPAHFTIELGLNTFRSEYFTQWNLFMAAALLAMIPPVLVFFIAQRHFIKGAALVGTGGGKG